MRTLISLDQPQDQPPELCQSPIKDQEVDFRSQFCHLTAEPPQPSCQTSLGLLASSKPWEP